METFKIVIIGAGFGGIGMAADLRKAGVITNNWPGFTFACRRLTRHVRPADYLLAGETP